MLTLVRLQMGCQAVELPAGLIDAHKGEGPEAAALRELLEETGFSGEARNPFTLR